MNEAAVILVRANNPGPLTGPGTNTWIFGREEAVVIDPGPLMEDHLAEVASRAAEIGRVAAVICTHHHPDHREGADRLCQMTGAPLGLFQTAADRSGQLPICDGDRILAGTAELVAFHTPGHARDHICLLAERERVLFTGDHVLSGTTSVIWPPDGDMADYIRSLERIQKLAVDRLLPGHGEPIADPKAAVGSLIAHRRERESQVIDALGQGPARPQELVPILYVDYPRAVWAAAAQTTLAHCLKLAAEGRLRQLGAGDEAVFELV